MAYTELFTERITFLKQTVAVSATTGFKQTVYAEDRSVWAERVKMSGSMVTEIGEEFPDYRIEFRTHIFYKCEEHWRIRYENRDYEVTSIIKDRRNGLQTISCTRINP